VTVDALADPLVIWMGGSADLHDLGNGFQDLGEWLH